jgi:hypothetical protein
MTEANPVPQATAQPSRSLTVGAGYLATVGGLLLVIIVVLATLWTRERGRRVDAEEAVVRLQKQNQQLSLMLTLSARSGAVEGAVQPFQRDDHVPVTVSLDGARREAYRLPAPAAERFGFREGDVILVVPAPATRPAPSTAPAP